jgi:lipopolysaccharide/colanic/teichoic acid biosynthesis glycosyltransferase
VVAVTRRKARASRVQTDIGSSQDVHPDIPGRRAEPGGAVVQKHVLSRGSRVFKRTIDLTLAPLLLLLTLPVLFVALVAIRLDSRGPLFFHQTRVGLGGRRFRLVKLRTMVVGNSDALHLRYVAGLIDGTAERVGGLYKLVNDPRITRVGAILRRLSIDELPQLWNVIRGDMSLVGPRPPMPTEVELYESWMLERFKVRPGITGLWQVSGRNRLSFHEMIRLDIAYWRSWTPRLELKILLRTVPAVFSKRGAA